MLICLNARLASAVVFCLNLDYIVLLVVAHDGTPVDEPVWQLREPGETATVSEQPTPLEEESDQAQGTLRCVPQGIVSTRYLTSPAATPDSHIHVFRETTV